MANYERKEGDVIIFKVDKKSDKQPDYRGTALVNGKEMKVSLWIKEGAKGKFFSGKIEEDSYKPANEYKKPESKKVIDDDDDSLPF